MNELEVKHVDLFGDDIIAAQDAAGRLKFQAGVSEMDIPTNKARTERPQNTGGVVA